MSLTPRIKWITPHPPGEMSWVIFLIEWNVGWKHISTLDAKKWNMIQTSCPKEEGEEWVSSKEAVELCRALHPRLPFRDGSTHAEAVEILGARTPLWLCPWLPWPVTRSGQSASPPPEVLRIFSSSWAWHCLRLIFMTPRGGRNTGLRHLE